MTDLRDDRRARSRSIDLIGYACGVGARDQGCRHGPDAFARRLDTIGNDLSDSWRNVIRTLSNGMPAQDRIALACRMLAREVGDTLRAGRRFAVIGGDHSSAIGTWSGVSRSLPGPLGLVWVDAHMDFHRPDTSPSGALHGMPLACLAGFGAAELIGLAGPRPALAPRHCAIVGVRSFETEEMDLARQVGLRVFEMAEVRRRGLAAVLDEALTIACSGTAGFGVTLDLDAFDPADAPGVGTPVPGGLQRAEVLSGLRRLTEFPTLAGIEIAEFNPAHDRSHTTARLMLELIETTLTMETDHEAVGR